MDYYNDDPVSITFVIMSSLFVILQKKSKINIPRIVDMALMELKPGNLSSSHSLIVNDIGFGCHLTIASPELKNELLPYQDTSTGCCVIVDARIDYRAKLIEQLGLINDQPHKLPDSRLIMLSYLKWGEKCVEYLYGDFAFVIWDPSRQILFCARDHFGCRPLYYINHDNYLAASTDPKAFKVLPEFMCQIDDLFILDAICSIVPNEHIQTYLGINRLEPAHTLIYSPGVAIQLNRYWDLRIQGKFKHLSEKEASRELKEIFIEAVRERSRSISPVGVELSGGLDSSSIASCLNQLIDRKIPVYALSHTLSNDQVVRPVSYNDEYYYILKMAQFSQLSRHITTNGENDTGSFSAVMSYLNIMMKPAVQSFAMMSDLLYDHASQAGIRVLLSGFGGDEGVTYQGGGLLEELAGRKDTNKLKEILKGRIKKKGGSYYRQLIRIYLKIRIPGLMHALKVDWRKSRYKVFAYDKKLALKFGMKKRYFERVQIPSDPNLRRRQYKRIMHPHITDRLENSYFLAKAKGIEYRYPFLDVKLIEFFYSIPSEYKYKNGTGRYLFRMAMEGILPEEIRLREDKTGATIPNVMYRIMKDERIFRELIEEGRKNNRFHYVDYNKLHWMLDQFKHEEKRKKMNFAPRAFLSPMSVLILQKWQREGRIDIGIKC